MTEKKTDDSLTEPKPKTEKKPEESPQSAEHVVEPPVETPPETPKVDTTAGDPAEKKTDPVSPPEKVEPPTDSQPEPDELSKKDLTGKEDDAEELKIDVDDTNDYCNTCFKNGKKIVITRENNNCPSCGGELQWGQ